MATKAFWEMTSDETKNKQQQQQLPEDELTSKEKVKIWMKSFHTLATIYNFFR